MTATLLKILPIKQDELKSSALFFAFSFCLGVFLTFYFVYANSGFINAYGPEKIPYAYITTGFLGFFVIKLFSYLKKKMTIERLYTITFTALLGLMLFFKLISTEFFTIPYLSEYSPFLLFVWIGPIYSICAIGFSGLFLKTFNLSQSKRLFALLYSGEVVSSIIGYFTVGILLKVVSERSDLIYISALGMVGTMVMLRLIVKHQPEDEEENSTKSVVKVETSTDKLSLRKNKYFGLIVIVASFSGLAAYLSDYGFLGGTKLVAQSDKQAVVEIIAYFYGIVKIAEFVLSFLSGRLLRLYGMKFGIYSLAIGMLFCTLLAYVLCLFLPESDIPIILFVLLALNRMVDRVFRKAIELPSFRVLFQPFEERHKFQVQTTVDGTVKQLTIGLAGVIILAMNLIFSGSDLLQTLIYFSLIFAVIAIGWVFFSLRLFDQYKKKLTSALNTTDTQEIKRELALTSIEKELNLEDSKLEGWNSLISSHVLTGAPIGYNFTPSSSSKPPIESEMHHHLLEPFILLNETFTAPIDTSTYNTKNHILELLCAGRYQIEVLNRLKHYGDDIIREMEVIFDRSSSRTIKARVIEGYASIGSELAILKIIEKLNVNDEYVIQHAIDALYDINFECVDKYDSLIKAKTYEVQDKITWLMSCMHDVNQEFVNLHDAFIERMLFQKEVLFKLLSFQFNPTSISLIQQSLNANAGEDNNIYALELIDNFFKKEDKEILLPIFSDGPLAPRIKSLYNYFPVRFMESDDRLKHIVYKSTFETGVLIKAEALQPIAEGQTNMGITEVNEILTSVLFSKNRVLQELAGILLYKFDTTIFNQYVVSLKLKERNDIMDSIKNQTSKLKIIKNIQKACLFNNFTFREINWCLEDNQAMVYRSDFKTMSIANIEEKNSFVFDEGFMKLSFVSHKLPSNIIRIWHENTPEFKLLEIEVKDAHILEFNTSEWIQFVCTNYDLFKRVKSSYLKAVS